MSGNVDTQDASIDAADGTDNAVIRELRAQLKEAKAQLKANDPAVVREQVLAEVNRKGTAASLMDKAGFPKLADLYAERVEGELSEDSAAEFLSGLGLTAEKPADVPVEEVDAGQATPAQIAAEVERLAGAANSLGSVGMPQETLDALLADAKTPDEVTKAMRAANLTVHGY